MKKSKYQLAFAALLLFSCSGVHVLNTESDPGFKLSQYKTFDFYKLEASGDTVSANFEKNAALLKESIAGKLQAKGLSQSSSQPGLLVNIGIMVEEKIQTRETTIRDAPRYVGTRSYSWKAEEIEVGRYKEGTVTVHLVDPATNKLMWKGAVEGILPTKNEKLPATIEEGMEALFSKL